MTPAEIIAALAQEPGCVVLGDAVALAWPPRLVLAAEDFTVGAESVDCAATLSLPYVGGEDTAELAVSADPQWGVSNVVSDTIGKLRNAVTAARAAAYAANPGRIYL